LNSALATTIARKSTLEEKQEHLCMLMRNAYVDIPETMLNRFEAKKSSLFFIGQTTVAAVAVEEYGPNNSSSGVGGRTHFVGSHIRATPQHHSRIQSVPGTTSADGGVRGWIATRRRARNDKSGQRICLSALSFQ